MKPFEANAFLDAVAGVHHTLRRPVISVSWGEWQWDAWTAGLQGYDEATRAFFINNRRTYGITFAEGMDALQRALTSALPHVFVTSQALADLVHLVRQTFTGAAQQADTIQQQLHPRPTLGTSYVAPSTKAEEQIAAIWSAVLGIEQIGINDNFFDLGDNSLLSIDLTTRMKKALHLEKLPAYIIYDVPSVRTLAEHISGQSQPELVLPLISKERAEKRRETYKQFKRRD